MISDIIALPGTESCCSIAILCNTASAIMVGLTLCICTVKPYSKHWNRCFHTPKQRSTVLRVAICALLYLSSFSFWGLRMGVKRYVSRRYPESPKSRPLNSPRSKRSLRVDSLKMRESWVLPRHLATISHIRSFASQVTCKKATMWAHITYLTFLHKTA